MTSFQLSENIDKDKVFLVNKSQIEKRLDPHFYKPEYGILINKLKTNKYKKLKEVVSFSNETWNQRDYFQGEFPYIEISEIDTLTGKINCVRYIPVTEAPSRAKMLVRNGDIIVSTTRPGRGAISLLDEKYDKHIASTGFSVIRKIKFDGIKKEFLYFMLRQKFSLKQMEQRSSGGNYPAITQEELSQIIIPYLDNDAQQKIIDIVKNSYTQKEAKIRQAKDLLASIDDYLLRELGIIVPEKNNELIERMFQTQFSNVSGTRFDPDYHSEYYKELERSIANSKYEIKELKHLTHFLKNGKTPASSKYSEDEATEYPIIKVGSYSGNYINLDKVGYTLSSNNSTAVRKGDIFILSAAHQAEYVGKHIKLLADQPKIPTAYVGELICVRPDETCCDPMFLFSLINLEIYKTLINREKTGQTSHVYGKDLRKIFIVAPSIEKQIEMADHIRKVRKQARQLQQEAKKELEKARNNIEELILQ